MLSSVGDFEDFDEEYLAELDNLNKDLALCDNDEAIQDCLNKSESRISDEDDYARCLVSTEEEEDIDSEEEKDILKGIRDEIETKVRDEMKDEIQVYKSQLLALEAGDFSAAKGKTDNGTDTNGETNGGEEEEMDPKLKEAFAKMRKLDRILMKKVKREKEVKRDRMVMERRLREEVSQMKHGATYFSEIKSNTEKFLALAAPLSHNAGMSFEDLDSDMPPLFQTEIDDNEIKKRGKRSSQGNSDQENSPQRDPDESASVSESSRNGSRASKGGNKEKGTQSQKDFIQRNKELAAASNEVVAMTDDEKKRLHELLGDLNDLPELEEDLNDTSSIDLQLTLNAGDGFAPDDNEYKSLTDIDRKLKSVMAEDDYKSVVASSIQSTPRQPLFTRVAIRTTASILDGFGERVLYETKEERDLNARLHAIEKELENFKSPQEMESAAENFHLTDELLDKLLDQCARSSSRVSVMESPDESARSNMSSRQALLANPPKLSDEQLQQLLSEAHFPMSSQLLALREDDEKIMDGDGTTEMIRAETWKTIINEDLDTNDEGGSKPSVRSPQILSSTSTTSKRSSSNQNNNHGKVLGDGDGGGQAKVVSIPACEDTHVNHFDTTTIDNNDILGEHGSSVSSNNSNSSISRGLPRIGQSNSFQRQSHSEIDWSGRSSPPDVRESSNLSADSVRLPKIASNSFLIHASQGLNNELEQSMTPTSSRQPLRLVHNDLSGMQLDSFSEDERDIVDNRRFPKRNSTTFPRPPAGSKPKDKSDL